jgi:ribosomal protein L37AE/L43A
MSERGAPFYCPYCGDEDIRPFGERHGDWRCGACRRVWALRYVGLARPATGAGAEPAGMVAAADGLEPT